MIKTSEIITFLSQKTVGSGWVDKLKVKYRPLICPFNLLLDYVGENNNVFDIGCGSGQFCSLVAKYTHAQDIYGIEISDVLIQNAKQINLEFQRNKSLRFEKYDGVRIPEIIKYYDIVYLIDVLHHVPESKQIDFIKEIHSKMKVGAKLVFKDINRANPFVIFNKLHDLLFAGELGHEITITQAQKIAIDTGFSICEVNKKMMFVYPHYLLILQK